VLTTSHSVGLLFINRLRIKRIDQRIVCEGMTMSLEFSHGRVVYKDKGLWFATSHANRLVANETVPQTIQLANSSPISMLTRDFLTLLIPVDSIL
jgi:hypothetical protein